MRNWSGGEPFCHCEKLLLSTIPECPVFTRATAVGDLQDAGGKARKTFHSDCTTLVVRPELAGE